jgi:hypothetical protein
MMAVLVWESVMGNLLEGVWACFNDPTIP